MSAPATSVTAMLGSLIASHRPSEADLGGARRSLLEARRGRIAGASTSAGERIGLIVADAGGTHTPAPLRAWADAALVQCSGMDDAVEYGSGGAAVWAALDALPWTLDDEMRRIAGATGLRLALAVYRVGRYQESTRGFSGAGVFGVLAATAAVAKAMDLDAARASAAMSIAASQAQGLSIDAGFGAAVLPTAGAARDGLVSALLAARGYTGAPDIFEARQGFGEAFFGLALSRLEGLEGQWQEAPSLDDELRFKVVPGHIDHQRPVRALRALLAEAGGASSVVVDGVPPTSGGNRFRTPQSPEQALHSVRHALACVLEHGTVRLADIDSPTAVRLDAVEVRSSSRWDTRLLDPTFAAWAVTVAGAGHPATTLDPNAVPASADQAESEEAWAAIRTAAKSETAQQLAMLEED